MTMHDDNEDGDIDDHDDGDDGPYVAAAGVTTALATGVARGEFATVAETVVAAALANVLNGHSLH